MCVCVYSTLLIPTENERKEFFVSVIPRKASGTKFLPLPSKKKWMNLPGEIKPKMAVLLRLKWVVGRRELGKAERTVERVGPAGRC